MLFELLSEWYSYPTQGWASHSYLSSVLRWLKFCAKYCLLKWQRQCTTPILNDELGLGSRVTLFWKPHQVISGVWLSLNRAIIIIILTAEWLILKEVEWLCPVHPGKEGQNEHITWRQGSDQGLFVFLCPVLVLYSLGPWVFSILSCFLKRSMNCDGVADKGRVRFPRWCSGSGMTCDRTNPWQNYCDEKCYLSS